jgi:hypothetical protein
MGYGATSHATATLALPTQVRIDGVSLDHGPGCTVAAQIVDCDLDWLNPGQDVFVIVSTTVLQPGRLDATASIWATGEDNRADNDAALALTVGDPATPKQATTASAAVAPVAASAGVPAPALSVKLSGAARAGATLRAVPRSVRAAGVTYRWAVCAGSRCTTPAGATNAWLTLSHAWVGRRVTVVVAAKGANGRVARATAITARVTA